MAPRAQWKRLPGDPTSPLGWIGRSIASGFAFYDLDTLPSTDHPFEHFPVTIRVGRNSLLYGTDRGVVSFVDGWLYVETTRTSFSLNDLDTKTMRPLRRGGYRLELSDHSYVVLTPDSTNGYQRDRALEKRLGEALRNWRTSSRMPEHNSVLPPTSPFPTAYAGPLSRTVFGALAGILGISLLETGESATAVLVLVTSAYLLFRSLDEITTLRSS